MENDVKSQPVSQDSSVKSSLTQSVEDSDVLTDVIYLVTNLIGAVAKALETDLAPYDLIPMDYEMLNRCQRGEANTVTEMARIFPVDPSAISRRVERLHRQGLIHRNRLRSDRRVVKLGLTTKGSDLMTELVETVNKAEAQILKDISVEEQAMFIAIAHKILENVKSGWEVVNSETAAE